MSSSRYFVEIADTPMAYIEIMPFGSTRSVTRDGLGLTLPASLLDSCLAGVRYGTWIEVSRETALARCSEQPIEPDVPVSTVDAW